MDWVEEVVCVARREPGAGCGGSAVVADGDPEATLR